MKLVLIGFMGSGKSCVAHALSKELHIPVIEMDKEIEKKAGKSIKEIFAHNGETAFRHMEIALAQDLRAKEHVIISTGGGVVMNKIIIDYLKEHDGKIIFLDASFDEISRRIGNDTSRPLFQDKRLAQDLYEFRLPLYTNYADVIITTNGKSIPQVVQEIKQTFYNT